MVPSIPRPPGRLCCLNGQQRGDAIVHAGGILVIQDRNETSCVLFKFPPTNCPRVPLTNELRPFFSFRELSPSAPKCAPRTVPKCARSVHDLVALSTIDYRRNLDSLPAPNHKST